MTAAELFEKYWPPNVNRSLWTDAHRHVAEVMFKVAWNHLWPQIQSKDVHQEDTDRLLYKEIEQVYELKKELQSKDERMGEWAEAADGEMSRLQTELERKDEHVKEGLRLFNAGSVHQALLHFRLALKGEQ